MCIGCINDWIGNRTTDPEEVMRLGVSGVERFFEYIRHLSLHTPVTLSFTTKVWTFYDHIVLFPTCDDDSYRFSTLWKRRLAASCDA